MYAVVITTHSLTRTHTHRVSSHENHSLPDRISRWWIYHVLHRPCLHSPTHLLLGSLCLYHCSYLGWYNCWCTNHLSLLRWYILGRWKYWFPHHVVHTGGHRSSILPYPHLRSYHYCRRGCCHCWNSDPLCAKMVLYCRDDCSGKLHDRLGPGLLHRVGLHDLLPYLVCRASNPDQSLLVLLEYDRSVCYSYWSRVPHPGTCDGEEIRPQERNERLVFVFSTLLSAMHHVH